MAKLRKPLPYFCMDNFRRRLPPYKTSVKRCVAVNSVQLCGLYAMPQGTAAALLFGNLQFRRFMLSPLATYHVAASNNI